MPTNPLDEIEDQEEQEELVVEVPEDEAPADEQEPSTPEPEAPKKPVEPAREPEPKAAPATAKPSDDDDEDDASLSEKVRKRIGKLTYKQRKAEREAAEFRQQLETLRQERERERQQYEIKDRQTEEFVLASREVALDAQIEKARQDYIAAYNSGELDKLMEADSRRIDLQVQKQELIRAKQRREAVMASRPAPQPDQLAQRPQQPSEFGDVQAKAAELVEEYIAKHHSWFDKNQAMTGAALAIDKKMQLEGLRPWEPSFYEELDRRMADEFPSRFGRSEPAATAPSAPIQRPSQPVAGVSRGTVKGSTSVRLDAEDKAFCDRHSIPYDLYGKEKLALERTKR